MKNMLIAIVGPIEVVMPILLGILGAVVLIGIFAGIMVKVEEKSVLKKATVVYPETLFQDIEEMKRVGALRLYSKRIKNDLFVVTSSQVTEEYKDGIFVSYAGEKPIVLKAKKLKLNEFINQVPEVEYKSMLKRLGVQVRIECKQQEKIMNSKIERIVLAFDYCSDNIWCYDSNNCLLSWNGSLIPLEWQEDKFFIMLSDKLRNQYEELFVNDKKVFEYVGFKNERQKERLQETIDAFVKYVNLKNNGKYEIINCLNIDSLNTEDEEENISNNKFNRNMEKYVVNIEYLEKNTEDCILTLNDGEYEIKCYSSNYVKGKPCHIYAFLPTNIVKVDDEKCYIKRKENFAYSIQGQLVSKIRGEIKIGEFYIQIKQGELLEEIVEGQYIQLDCTRLDYYSVVIK